MLVDTYSDLVNESCYTPLLEAASAALIKALEQGEEGEEGGEYFEFNTVGKVVCGLESYVARVAQFMKCSEKALLSAFVLLDRTASLIPLTRLNAHKLFFTAVVLTVKYVDDLTYSNSYYAKIGGIHAAQLFHLEATMLKALDWRVHVDPAVLKHYEDVLQCSVMH
eukprot:TRINITY_DN3974_c3_g1_i1.p2 TRINITY_DN3974_c3_g1~~TRINITY_DN3974_c3_g1_i1.p2  ORF type:complete len:166 (+),score=33.71 TRINITY_DN3974_c3_g1_i1:64-561(+)